MTRLFPSRSEPAAPLAVGLLALLAACGGGGGGSAPPVTPPTTVLIWGTGTWGNTQWGATANARLGTEFPSSLPIQSTTDSVAQEISR